MPSIVLCPACNRQLQIPDDLLGQHVRCPSCRQIFASTASEIRPPASAASEMRRPPPPEPEPDDSRQAHAGKREYVQPHRGTLILVLGILSIVICGFLGPVPWIMGSSDLKQIRAGRMDRMGEGTTQAGMICGIIGSILAIFQFGFCCLGILGNLANAFH